MADKKISQLTALSAANVASATDVLAIVDTSATETKKITAKDLIDGALNGGTANGVLYLNGSKVATSGSALVFDGTNLGIGTASPVGRADVNASISSTSVNTSLLNLKNTLGSGRNGNELFGITFQGVDQTNGTTYTAAAIYNRNPNSSADYDSGELLFYTKSPGTYSAAPTERLRIDTSGNLGLGVTPSAWTATFKALQVSNTIIANNGSADSFFGSNYYFNGTNNVYISSAHAATYGQVDGAHQWYTAASGTAGNTISFTQAMTLDADGDLSLGTTSPTAFISGDETTLTIKGKATSYASAITLINNAGTITAGYGVGNTVGAYFGTSSNHPVLFQTNGTERGRFTAGGYFKASNSGTYLSSTGTYHEFYQSANAEGLRVYTSDSSTYNSDTLKVDGERATTNSTYNLGNFRNGNGTGQCIIRDSGNIVNTNNSYGQISDIKTKQDVADAASQWDDIKGVRVRKFRFKNDPSGPLQIGVVAQELEQVSPGLVDEASDYEEVEVTDAEGNVTKERQPTGTVTKSVKYSVLYMKAIKALQEAMARIESLEAKVAALEAK